MTRRIFGLLTLLIASVANFATADDVDRNRIVLLPKTITLKGPASRHAFLVQTQVDGEIRRQPSTKYVIATEDPTVAKVEDGMVKPVGDGTTKLLVRAKKAGKVLAESTVRVTAQDAPTRWSFRNHVQPVLAKSGCNGGACHGALAGKGGLKLSLRGYDTVRDHFTITRQARGRRIELADPGRSLILAKPSGGMPHKGGLRFDVDSRQYEIIAGWIADGAQAPTKDDPRVVELNVLPKLSVLAKGDQQPLIVQARFSDGEVRDVTAWCKFSSTNETVARVDKAGKIDVIGNGEGAVTAWYDSRIVIARVTSPYANKVPATSYSKIESRGFIDKLIVKQLQRLNLEPSPPASDEEFVRRVYLDCIGALPTADETRQFMTDDDPAKRDKLIDALLDRKEFVDYWTYKWSDVLMLNGTLLRPDALKAYYQWIRGHVEKNTRWDAFVTEILTARGSTVENGATNFYSLHQDPEAMTENACQAFLGLSIGCAKCHNHPLEKWTNDQYYSMANLFARVRAKGWGGDARNGSGVRTLYVASRGDLIQPLSGKALPPTPLDGETIPMDDPGDRRVHLAKWMTSTDNPYFARSITNRIWQNFFGVGLIEPVDDMRASNPASNEELLSAAAAFLAENDFDVKVLMREIMRSSAYQRSSKPLPGNAEEQRFYSRYYPKRLMAEVLLDALSQVSEQPSKFDQILFPGADKRKTDFYPIGTKAIQLYDSAVDSYFLKTFGRNSRRITCECERSDEPTMVQVLHLSNGLTLNEKLRAEKNRLGRRLAEDWTDEQILDELFLAALARKATEREKASLLQLIKDSPKSERRIALEDMYWGVLSSREFIFNH